MSEHLSNIVVCGLIVRDGKIFVAKRADHKTAFPGQYELIGGHVDPDEQLEVALRREIREELGVEVVVDAPIGAFTYSSEGVFKIEICYLCHPEDPATEPTLNPADHSEAKWIGAGDIALLEKEDEETEILRTAFEILEGEN